jgi:hypothetical protein
MIQQRGAAVIKTRGASSAASAASAALDHMRTWIRGTEGTSWTSMGVASDGSYGIAPGIFFGYPVRTAGGRYEIESGLELDAFARERIALTEKELRALLLYLLPEFCPIPFSFAKYLHSPRTRLDFLIVTQVATNKTSHSPSLQQFESYGEKSKPRNSFPYPGEGPI